jgi:hypothetical protein
MRAVGWSTLALLLAMLGLAGCDRHGRGPFGLGSDDGEGVDRSRRCIDAGHQAGSASYRSCVQEGTGLSDD